MDSSVVIVLLKALTLSRIKMKSAKTNITLTTNLETAVSFLQRTRPHLRWAIQETQTLFNLENTDFLLYLDFKVSDAMGNYCFFPPLQNKLLTFKLALLLLS